MFLNQLSHQEKKMFLDLSIHIAKANDFMSAEEKQLISGYCIEMQLPPIELYETESLETIFDYFSMSDFHVKKIVMLEILGLVYADGSYDSEEEKVVKQFAEKTGISDESYAEIHDVIKKYYLICKEMSDVIS